VAIHRHLAIWAQLVDNQVLEVTGGEEFSEVLNEADQAVLAHYVSQLSHRRVAHAIFSFWLENGAAREAAPVPVPQSAADKTKK
jgi:hypothetical protein